MKTGLQYTRQFKPASHKQGKYSIKKHTLTTCLGWNLVVSFGVGLINLSLSIFTWIFCRAFMLLSLKGTEWSKPLGNAIPSWLVGIPPGGYTPPGWPGPNCAASAATKFWARRTWQEANKHKHRESVPQSGTFTIYHIIYPFPKPRANRKQADRGVIQANQSAI